MNPKATSEISSAVVNKVGDDDKAMDLLVFDEKEPYYFSNGIFFLVLQLRAGFRAHIPVSGLCLIKPDICTTTFNATPTLRMRV